MPAWINQGFHEYAKRLPAECALQLHEITAGRRGKSADIARLTEAEGRDMLGKVPGGAKIIALDQSGKSWSTAALSKQLESWMFSGQDVALLVGGPEGLSNECQAKAEQCWSLSALTLPHPLVRVVVAEALYRAWSLMRNHPYHRE